MPFIVGKVAGEAGINEQLDRLPAQVSRTYTVESDGLTTPDGIHFDRASLDELGARYADGLLAMVLRRSPSPPSAEAGESEP